MLRPSGIAALLAAPVLAAPPSAPADAPVARAVVPVLIEPARCAALDPAGIVVEEDGVRYRALALDRRPPPRVHAILVDDSATTEPFAERIEQALADYLGRIPAGESVLVATFADDLILRAPLSAERPAKPAPHRGRTRGQATSALDALESVLALLAPRTERKSVVLFTGRAGDASLGTHAQESLSAIARRAGDVTLFTIRLGGESRKDSDRAAVLERLSIETGGAFFDVRGAAAIGAAFRSIGERLAAEAWLTYEPAPTGPVWREVRVHAADPTCRLEVPGARRFAGHPGGPVPESLRVDALPPGSPPPAVLAEFCPVGRTCWKGVEELGLAGAADARITIVSPPSYLVLRALETTVDRGARYDETVLGGGRFLLVEDGAASLALRDMALELPPLAEVRERIRSPVDVLERWMRKGGGGPAAFVNGRTWLELRPLVGRAIHRARTDYQEWADQRLAPIRETAADVHAVLADWISDVPARDLALALEARVAERARTLADAEREVERERLEAFWVRLLEWFPAPSRVRVVTPLIACYDAARDVIGFHRILLPRPRRDGPPVDLLPPFPLGLRILERLLRDPVLERRLAQDATITGIDFRPVVLGERAADRKRPRETAFASAIRFGPIETEVVLTTFLVGPASGMDLRCMNVSQAVPSAPLADLLRDYVERSGLGCARGFEAVPVDER